MNPPAADCIKYEELIERSEFTDAEVEFILNHPDVCHFGLHQSVNWKKAADAMFKMVGINRPEDRQSNASRPRTNLPKGRP